MMRDRLIELFHKINYQSRENGLTANLATQFTDYAIEQIADKLIAEGVILTPCVAMVEQFIKDGKFDRKHTAHNGRFAVVYVDKSKFGCPLIDITEQFYDTEKAVERIRALKGEPNET